VINQSVEKPEARKRFAFTPCSACETHEAYRLVLVSSERPIASITDRAVNAQINSLDYFRRHCHQLHPSH